MKVTIIHKEDCPLCELAKNEFRHRDPEMYENLNQIADTDRRNGMLADLADNNGEPKVYPQVFINDRFVAWQPA